MNYEHLTDPEKIELIYKIFGLIHDQITKIWCMAWGADKRAKMTIWDYQQTEKLVKDYGYEKTADAFGRAKDQEIFKISYVRGILTKQLAQENATKAEEENRRLKFAKATQKETIPDLEKVKEAFKFPEPIREKMGINYEQAKQEFERELDKR